MIVRAIRVYVKPEYVGEFMEISKMNHEGSLREPGILRFDVLQSSDSPGEFLLYEVYDSEEATRAHKETAHYHAWKNAVEKMMAKPRESATYTPVAPTGKDAWR